MWLKIWLFCVPVSSVLTTVCWKGMAPWSTSGDGRSTGGLVSRFFPALVCLSVLHWCACLFGDHALCFYCGFCSGIGKQTLWFPSALLFPQELLWLLGAFWVFNLFSFYLKFSKPILSTKSQRFFYFPLNGLEFWYHQVLLTGSLRVFAYSACQKEKGKSYSSREDLLFLCLIFSSLETIASSHSDVTVSCAVPSLPILYY